MTIPRWPRPRFVAGGAPARVLILVFAPDALPGELPLSESRHGVPEGGVPETLALRSVSREEQPDWFAGLFAEPMLGRAREALGEARLAALLASRFAHVVSVEQTDPADLGYLQAVWAVVRCLGELGAAAALDTHAIRWHDAEALRAWPPTAGPDLDRELSIIFEDQPQEGLGHLAHTRGLAKFGRPDLVVTGLSPDEATLAGVLLRKLAVDAALGERYEAGGTADFEGEPITFEAYEPGRGGLPQLNLNNAGLIVR